MNLLVPASAAEAIRREVMMWGDRPAETGLFLLGRGSSVDVLAWPGTRGVVRRKCHFAVDGLALARLFDWADRNDRTIQALIHSHGGAAFLSRTDVANGFAVPGFVSGVVPSYRNPPPQLSEWGWWRFEDGWHECDPPRPIETGFDEIRFDLGGVE